MKDNSYYTTTGRKVVDFLIGFFGLIIFGSILSTILLSTVWRQGLSGLNALFMPFIQLVYGIPLAVYFFKFNKRRYIGIGLIIALVVPLLFFGSCLLIISTLSG
jgi:predicted permease